MSSVITEFNYQGRYNGVLFGYNKDKSRWQCMFKTKTYIAPQLRELEKVIDGLLKDEKENSTPIECVMSSPFNIGKIVTVVSYVGIDPYSDEHMYLVDGDEDVVSAEHLIQLTEENRTALLTNIKLELQINEMCERRDLVYKSFPSLLQISHTQTKDK
jgi:hypothetical protein